jgi:tetratricopeptide (TPR) repeat protein
MKKGNEEKRDLIEKVRRNPMSTLFVPLAEMYRKDGQFDEAIDALKDGIRRQPAYMSAKVALGKIYMEKGMMAEAKEEFKLVAVEIPGNLFAQKKLAEIYVTLGEESQALAQYKRVMELNPLDEEAHAFLEKHGGDAKPEAAGGSFFEAPKDEEEEPEAAGGSFFEAPKDEAAAEFAAAAVEEAPDAEVPPDLMEETEEFAVAVEEELPDAEVPLDLMEETAKLAAADEEIPGGEVSYDLMEETEEFAVAVEEELPDTEVPLDLMGEEADLTATEEEAPDAGVSYDGIVEEADLTVAEEEVPDTGVYYDGIVEEEPVQIKAEAEEEAPKILSQDEVDNLLGDIPLEGGQEGEGGFPEEDISVDEALEESKFARLIDAEGEGSGGPPVNVGMKLAEADAAIAQGEFSRAADLYDEILEEEPGNQDVVQRARELSALLKVMGMGNEMVKAKLEGFLDGIKARRDEFFKLP